MWWRYGTLRQESRDSWAYCRLPAFAITALLDGQTQVISVGRPVSGFLEAARGDKNTAQLTGRPPISASGWKLRHPRPFPGDVIDVNGGALLPDVASGGYGHTHPPNVPFARLRGHKVPKYFDMPIGPDPANLGRQREHRNSPERRLLERFRRKQAGKRAAAYRHPRRRAPPA